MTANTGRPRKTDAVVVGGGYAGVMAANRLTQRDDVAVTLIIPRPRFVERIRLHQLVGGSDDAVVDYQQVLAEGIRLVVDTATRINAAERSVTLETGDPFGYDHLIYAIGSGSPYFHPRGRRSVAKGLSKLGVTVLEGPRREGDRGDTRCRAAQ